ncbi:MAG TPA: hypothetical protein VMW16_09580 [Sedimentisphaerales bacterium]|nr:hypothetical protein [Sedimentisphaerales bacterium]
MSYLWRAGSAEDDSHDVEAEGPVFYVVGGEEIAGGPERFGFFWGCDDGLDGVEGFTRPGFDLDEDDRAVGVDHDQIDFAGLTGEVAGEEFEAFSFEEGFAAFLAPSAEPFAVGK